MKDVGVNMHGLGLLFMPLVGTKMAKSRFWGVPPLILGGFGHSDTHESHQTTTPTHLSGTGPFGDEFGLFNFCTN